MPTGESKYLSNSLFASANTEETEYEDDSYGYTDSYNEEENSTEENSEPPDDEDDEQENDTNEEENEESSEVVYEDGSEEFPFLISTAEQLNAIRDNLLGHYRLVSDIDLSSIDWIPVGTNSFPFTGVFDGNGHEISNLTVNRPAHDNVGLFGFSLGTLENVTLRDISVTGRSRTGGLVGHNGHIISESSVVGSSTVTGSSSTGGLVGNNNRGMISGSSSTAEVLGTSSVGGLVGMTTSGAIEGSSAVGNVSGTTEVGGFAGFVSSGTVELSYATGDVSASDSSSGGFAGFVSSGTVELSYATGNVSGTSNIGGFVGNKSGGSIERSYASGSVSGTREVGGFVGLLGGSGAVRNSFFIGTVTEVASSGGFVGRTSSSASRVENCYVVTRHSMGLAGNLFSTSSIVRSYFNRDLAPLSNTNTHGRTTAQMLDVATYIGWDFNNIWEIDEYRGYPMLRGLPKPVITLNPDISKVVSPEGAIINRDTVQITATVPNEIDAIPIDIILHGEAAWQLYSDSDLTQKIETHSLELLVGANQAYIQVSSPTHDAKVYTITITRQTPRPNPISGLRTISGTHQVRLFWDMAHEAAVTQYRILRSTTPESGYREIARVNGRHILTFTDTTATLENEYFYKISAVNILGAESFLSVAVMGIALVDTTPPVILGVTPTNGSLLGRLTGITVRAEDNTALSNVRMEQYDNDSEAWTIIGTRFVTGKTANPVFTLTSLDFDGEINLRFIATDLSGNESAYATRTYSLKSSGPEKLNDLTAEPFENSILLRWNDVEDETFSYFVVEQKDTPNGVYRRIATVRTTLGFQAMNLQPDRDYWFRVAASDVFDNWGEFVEISTRTLPDATRPVVTSIRPLPGSYSTTIPVTVSATDNAAISEIWVEISEDMQVWEIASTIAITPPRNSVSVTINVSITEIPERSVFVRAFAKDTSGNVSHPSAIVEHRVDRTPPEAPTGLRATPAVTSLTIEWDRGVEPDILSYNIYRATSESGSYTLLAQNLSSLGFIDRAVAADITYWYRVSVRDVAGNRSHQSEPISVETIADVVPPHIHSVSPANNASVGKNSLIRVLAQDNGRLRAIYAEYQYNGQWHPIGMVNASGDSFIGNFTWQNSTLPGGTYNLRFIAIDEADNVSDYFTISYNLQNFTLARPVVTAVPGNFEVTVTWSQINASNLQGYRLFRSDASGDRQLIAIAPNFQMRFVDRNLDPARSYEYFVEVSDIFGNVARSEIVSATPLDNDVVPPVARAGFDITTLINVETAFDGSASTDNVGIVSFHWDFGDGNTAYTAKAVNVYTSTGDFTATLTVFDAAGNSHSHSINVRVLPPTQGGTLRVRVVDSDTGLPLPFAGVYIDFPDEPVLTRADANGVATIVGEPGNYSVSAYITDYLPREVIAQVRQHETSEAIIALEAGELIIGQVITRRLPLSEIAALGIDTSTPENQHVYNFEVTLVFQEKPLIPIEYTINSIGQIVRSTIKGSGFGTGQVPLYGRSGKLVAVATPQIIPSEHPELPPTIAFLKMSQSVGFLREFFEVSVVMQNMADPQFVLEDSVVTLNLPLGLTLAPMLPPQTHEIYIGSIAGGQEASCSWIVRGDHEGEYELTVYYKGTLMPFKEPVEAVFTTESPLVVNGSSGLSLTLYPNEYVASGMDYLVPFALKNESDVTFNLVTMHFNGSIVTKDPEGQPLHSSSGTHYMIATVDDMDDLPILRDGDSFTILELFPGDVLYGSYIVRFSTTDTWLSSIYVLQSAFTQQLSGSTMQIPVYIEPIEGLPLEVIEHIINKMLRVLAVDIMLSGILDGLLLRLSNMHLYLTMATADQNRNHNMELIQEYLNNPTLPSAFDFSGFIVNQNAAPINGTRFGPFGNGAANGCGAVAIFNALKVLNEPFSFEDVVYSLDMAGGSFAGGLLGSNPMNMQLFFTGLGYSTSRKWLPNDVDATIRNSDVVILTYAHPNMLSSGMHTIAVHYDADLGKFISYNVSGIETEKELFDSIDNQVIKNESRTPIHIITIGGSR